MQTTERRIALLRILCRRRYETMKNLAQELGVSERTIRRDIDILSLTEPLYTKTGRYEGGVYVVENYYYEKTFLRDDEIESLCSILKKLETYNQNGLFTKEIETISQIIKKYTKPTNKSQ